MSRNATMLGMVASYFAAIVAGLLIAGIDAGGMVALIGLFALGFGLMLVDD